MFVCKVNKGCKLAIELDPELSIIRHEPDLVDELPDASRSFLSGMLVIEGFGQIHDLLTVEFGKVRVQSRHGRGSCFKLREEYDSLSLQGRHLVLDGDARHARLDCFDHSANCNTRPRCEARSPCRRRT